MDSVELSKGFQAGFFCSIFYLCAVVGANAADPSNGNTAASGDVLYESSLSSAPIVVTGELKLLHSSELVVLDTGSSLDLILDEKVASTFGARVRRITNKGVPAWTYQAPASTLGAVAFPSGETASADFGMFRARLGLPLHGVVGWPALKGRTLIMDYDQHQLKIVEGARTLPDQKASVPLTVDSAGRPQMKVDLGGQDAKLLVDTGFDGSISLLPGELDRLNDKGWIHLRKQRGKSTNLSGSHEARSGWFTQGSMLGIPLTGMSVETAEENSVGLAFLSRLDLAISNDPSILSYKPRTDTEAPLEMTLMTGLILQFDEAGGAAVAAVKPGGPADKAGLKSEDEVLKIEEMGEKKLNGVSLYALCEKYAGRPVTLHIRRGGEEQKIVMTISAPVSAWDTQAAVEAN